MALLGPSRRFPCAGCRALGPQPRAAPSPPSLPPGAGPRCQAGLEQRGATSCSATPRSRPCPGHGAGAWAAPPPSHSPHSFRVHSGGAPARTFPKERCPGRGCPSACCPRQGHAAGVSPHRHRQAREPGGAAPCAGRGAGAAAGSAGPVVPSGPGGRQIAPRCPGLPRVRRWLIGAAGSSLGEAGAVFAGGGWFPPSLAGLIGQTAPWQEGDRDHAGSAPRQ